MNIRISNLKLAFSLILICSSIITNISCSGDNRSQEEIKYQKHYNKGIEYYKDRKFDEAIKEFEQAININPKNADSYFELGRIYNFQKNYEESVKAYEKGLQIDPEGSYFVFFHLGLNYYNSKQFDKSLENLHKAEKLITDEYSYTEYSVNFILAKSYFLKKNYDKAIKYFKIVLELQPDYVHGYYLLSNCYINKRNHKDAINILENGLKQHPNSIEIITTLSWLLATSTFDNLRDGNRAFKLAERAVDFTDGKNHNHLDTLAAAYAELGQFDDAIKTEENAIKVLTDPTVTPSFDESTLMEYEKRLSYYNSKNPWRE